MSTSIFTFDHGQKKINDAIGVSETYLKELGENVTLMVKNSLFDENHKLVENFSPSMLVELCLHNFSYNQLVILASFYVRDKLDNFEEFMTKKLESITKKISLKEDEIPQNIKDMLIKLSETSKDMPINEDDLPKEIKDFLDGLNKDE